MSARAVGSMTPSIRRADRNRSRSTNGCAFSKSRKTFHEVYLRGIDDPEYDEEAAPVHWHGMIVVTSALSDMIDPHALRSSTRYSPRSSGFVGTPLNMGSVAPGIGSPLRYH